MLQKDGLLYVWSCSSEGSKDELLQYLDDHRREADRRPGKLILAVHPQLQDQVPELGGGEIE